MESYVLSILGADRAGLVAALADVVADHDGNWVQSQMTEMAGLFAGMVLVQVPADRAESFPEALAPLRDQGLMDVTLRPASTTDGDAAPLVGFQVTGADRPGIVHEVSDLLSSRGVGIVDLRTRTESAAMAGGTLFRAQAVVRLPGDMDRVDLATELESLAGDLMVDLVED